MKNINKILAVSLIAMLAVPAAHAKIVAETMLSEQAGHYSGSHTVQSEINAKQDTLVPDTNIAGAGGVSVTKANGVITITGNSSDVSGLAERVTTAEGEIDALQSGKVDANSAITGATKTKITYDSKGLVTAGADLEASDIPTLTMAKISDAGSLATKSEVAESDLASALATKINGKADSATTLAGYGITDAYTKTAADGKFQTLANKTTDLSGTFADDTEYPSAKAVKAAITAAAYDDSALDARLDVLEGSGEGSVAKAEQDAKDYADGLASNYDAAGSAAAAQTAAATYTDNAITALDLANTYAAKSHNHASSDVNAMTGYAKAQTAAAIEATDSLNTAIGKLEKKVDDAGSAATTPASASAAGVAKLYTSTGDNTDGSMTQKAVTDALDTKLTKNTAITGATKTKITYDANGLVTAGANLEASDIPDIAESQVTGLVSDLAAKQTTANMVTDENAYNAAISDTTKYPNVAVVNKMIADNNNETTGALALKIDKTVAGDKNSVMVRNGSGVYVKGLGNAVSVANDGTITVNQATNATNATNDGSGNNIANTYATKTEVTNVSDTVAGLDLTDAQSTGSGNVVTSVTQSDGQIAVVKNIKAIPEPTITDTTGTLVLTAKAAQGGGYEFRWEDLGR